jgi:hypothetical protein
MQDKNGSDSGHLVPGTWYLAPMPNFPTSNLNKALLWESFSDMAVRRDPGPARRCRARALVTG